MTEPAERIEAIPAADSSSDLLTILLADIRGYTAYTKERGDEAASVLSEQFLALCREVFASHQGALFGSAGDQALAAFASARHALRAAVALQARLAAEQLVQPSLPLQAGIGLDAGEVVRVGADYRGGAINLAARLCSLAGPGEIFASEGVIHLAGTTEGLTFLDRGAVTLKGLPAPVRVIHIATEGEELGDLPPLQPILVIHPTNLPDDPTPFIGRAGSITAITDLLQQPGVRLLTLTGPGGTGKTRLVLQVGATLLPTYRDGVFFVSLASLADPALVPFALAEVLAVKEQAGGIPLLDTLCEHLGNKHLVVVLDNFEHLLPASSLVASLLAACRELHFLVTSRIPLHLSREYEYPVPPLSIPDPRRLPSLEQFSQYEAVALFIERAKATKADFVVTSENAPAVAEICSRLDGLPLAIELAAARLKLFPPQALLGRLSRRLQLLTGGARDRPTRQQTLRGAIDWSYSLLTAEEQRLFARLSVFAGGGDIEAAEAVGEGELEVLEGVESLVDKSLVRQVGEEEPRLVMLETIREYAGEKLVERGEEEEVRAAHAAYFLQLAETAEAELQGPGQAAWLVRLDGELDNLRAVLSWYLDQGKREQELRLASALYRFWSTRGYWSEGRRWLEDGLAKGEDAAGAVRATAIWRLGSLVISIGDLERARRLEEEALDLFRALGDRKGCAGTLNALGMISDAVGNYDVATERYQACLELYRGLGDTRGTAAALVNLGVAAAARLDHDEAKRLYEEALPLCRQIGDRRTLGTCLNNLGVTARAQGNLEEARMRFEESLVVSRELGRKDAIAFTLGNLAGVELQQGAYEPAADGLRESLLLSRELGDLDVMLALLGGTAELAVVVGAFERAACLGGAETALRQVSGIARQGNDRAGWDRTMERAHRELGEEEWNRAWAAGQAMSLDDVLAYALDEKP